MAENKYGQYISKDPLMVPNIKPKASYQMVNAREELWPALGGISCNFAFICITEPYMMPDPPHTHDVDEFLFFIGGNPMNMGDFGAEIEIALGEEWERHVITSTSIIYIPKGLQHCPVNVKRVDKPILFGHVMPSSKYAKESEKS
jgi:hypothetical protein